MAPKQCRELRQIVGGIRDRLFEGNEAGNAGKRNSRPRGNETEKRGNRDRKCCFNLLIWQEFLMYNF